MTWNKRGQVTIFVIVAIVIVGVIALIFFFPQVNVFIAGDVNPSAYLKGCIEPKVDEVLNVLTKQGGYSQPTNYVLYQGEKIQYLCYTSESYKPCVVQQPLLIRHVENEIGDYIKPIARQCVGDLEAEYEKRGYNVRTTPGDVNVSIVMNNIVVDFVSPMTIEKESTQTFRKFAVSIESELYDLLSIATNIIQFESTLGGSETSLYLQYYPDLRIDKTKRNGDTIYKLSDVTTGDEFTFASRSLVWPEGYT